MSYANSFHIVLFFFSSRRRHTRSASVSWARDVYKRQDYPGIYVAEEGIGIRLENDILVTENGPEDLTGSWLLDIREIEELMGR